VAGCRSGRAGRKPGPEPACEAAQNCKPDDGAAAQVLKQFFGTDHVRFATCSYTLPPGQTCTDASPVLRRYASFTQAADENGLSRILVGFHFRKAVTAGIAHGTKIGDWTADRFLQPVHQPNRPLP